MKLKTKVHSILQIAANRFLKHHRVSNLFFRSDLVGDSRLFRDFGDHRFVFDPTEWVGRKLLLEGNFNRTATLQAIDKAIRGRHGGVMIEIGANIGTQTVYAALAHDFDRIIAIEPDSQNLKLLQTNIQLNNLASRVDVVHGAVSSAPGILELKRNVHNSGASTVEKLADWLESDGVTTEQVVAYRGDELIASLGVLPEDIRLIWIDVEGHEASVFEGMPRLLQSKPAIYFEYSAHRLNPEQRKSIFHLVFDTYDHVFLHRDGVFKVLSREDFELLPNRRNHVDLLVI